MRVRGAGDLGAAARQRRRDLKLSQEELATRAGVTRQWLVRFERGNAEITLSKALAVVRELDLTVRVNAPDAAAATSFVIPTVDASRLEMAPLNHDELRARIKRLDAGD